MHYSILIYEKPEDFALRVDPERQQSYWEAWPSYSQALREAGVFVTGSGLQGPDTARTVRLSEGKRLVLDGPFAETKEQLGGFLIIDVPDMDTALEWAARCPRLPHAVMEVRPVLPGACSAS